MKPDLTQLRDIHLPPPISWWPPAPGWWILAALILTALAFAYFLARRHRRERWRREALAELANLHSASPQERLSALSVLLRRVAITRFPRDRVATLTGEAWLDFLDNPFEGEKPFKSGGRKLLSGPYSRDSELDIEPLMNLCERWIRRLPAKGVR